MLIGIIPDIHQTTYFNKMVEDNIDHLDKLVFLGDYVDNWEAKKWWNIPSHNPINIVNKVISYKKKYPNKIDLLLGNHCLSYLSKNPHSKNVSGHQLEHDEEIAQVFLDNINLFKIAVEYDGWVISHAGFSKTWVYNQINRGWNGQNETIIEWCNRMIVERNFHYFDWTGTISPNGDEITQTPTWIRPFSLEKDPCFRKQIVGHSEITIAPVFVKNNYLSLVLADSPEHKVYLEFDTNNPPKFETVETVLEKIKKNK